VIEKLASVEVKGDRAVNPPKIEKVTVRREALPKKAGSAPKPAAAPAPAAAPSG